MSYFFIPWSLFIISVLSYLFKCESQLVWCPSCPLFKFFFLLSDPLYFKILFAKVKSVKKGKTCVHILCQNCDFDILFKLELKLWFHLSIKNSYFVKSHLFVCTDFTSLHLITVKLIKLTCVLDSARFCVVVQCHYDLEISGGNQSMRRLRS